MALVEDRRTPEEMDSHRWLVVATDSFMSRLGAECGMCRRSIAAWACKFKDVDRVRRWVDSRPEMKKVRLATDKVKPQRGDHVSVYVVRDDHPSLTES